MYKQLRDVVFENQNKSVKENDMFYLYFNVYYTFTTYLMYHLCIVS